MTNGVPTTRRGFLASLLAVPALAAAPPAEDDGPIAALDEAMGQFLRDHRVVGGSLAVGRGGRILHARGYGLANLEARQPVPPEALFCIGSVSKPFTAAGILGLVDDGRLKLEDRLVDVLDHLHPLPGQAIVDPRFRAITIHHLLSHAGGFPRDNKSTDLPQPPQAKVLARQEGLRGPLNPEMVYRVAMGGPLAFTPGTEGRYSNFGFVVLRLVIERVARMPYEAFIKQRILRPIGIDRMQLEPRGPEYRPGEVRHYDGRHHVLPGGIDPLVNIVGNWLASPTDLVRFLMAFDEGAGRPLLSARVKAMMLAPPPPPSKSEHPNRTFGLGWDTVRHGPKGVTFAKSGGKVGWHAFLEHLPDGTCWAAALNTTPSKGGDDDDGWAAVARSHVRAAFSPKSARE